MKNETWSEEKLKLEAQWSAKTLAIVASMAAYATSALVAIVVMTLLDCNVVAKFLAVLIPNLILLPTNSSWRAQVFRGNGRISGEVPGEDGGCSVDVTVRRWIFDWYIGCLCFSAPLTFLVGAFCIMCSPVSGGIKN